MKKNSLFKFSLVIVCSAFFYISIVSFDKKDACANWWDCAAIPTVLMEFVGAISAIMNNDFSAISSISFVGQYIQKVKDMGLFYIEKYFDLKKEESKELRKMMQKIARQDREANIAVTGQRGAFEEAVSRVKKTTLFNKDQVNTLAKRFPAPSEQVCQDTNIAIRNSYQQKFVDFDRAINRETNRLRNISVPAGQGQNLIVSSSSLGPVVRNKALKESLRSFCHPDEQLGNTGSPAWFCRNQIDLPFNKNPVGSYVSSLTGSGTLAHLGGFAPSDSNHLLQEMLFPPASTLPTPKSIANDVAVQNMDLQKNANLARRNLNQEILSKLSSERVEYTGDWWDSGGYAGFTEDMEAWYAVYYPDSNTGVPRPYCMRALDTVRHTYSEAYGHHIFDMNRTFHTGAREECPSLQTFKHATTLGVSSSAGLTRIFTEKEANIKQSELQIAAILQQQSFDIFQRDRLLALQTALLKVGTPFGADAPVDSIGRGN